MWRRNCRVLIGALVDCGPCDFQPLKGQLELLDIARHFLGGGTELLLFEPHDLNPKGIDQCFVGAVGSGELLDLTGLCGDDRAQRVKVIRVVFGRARHDE